MRGSTWVVACMAVVTFFPAVGGAQQTGDAGEEVLNLFFDCQAPGCFDMDFLRREIPVVNWVRDREVSDLHVLVTFQVTGGGGFLYSLSFIGRADFEGQDQELTVGTAGDATQDEQRQAVSDRLKVGLVRYLLGTAAADQIVVSLGTPSRPGGPDGPRGPQAASAQDDPWNFWAFRVGGNASLSGESSITNSTYSGNFSANRTTDAWKFNLSGRYSRNEREFVISDTIPPVVSLIENWSATSLLVKSLTAQWSIGATAGAGRSSIRNEDLRWNISPGVEYNFVPYSESSRRSFTLQALMNLRHWDYDKETVYGKTAETRVAASLTGAVSQVQPWGSMQISLTGSQYLHDKELYQVSLFGIVSVRLFRGLSVNMFGSYAWIRDQLYIPAGAASTEEVLLRQRQLQTSFRYTTRFGFTYQFGSIFNNIVNPRFGGGGGGIFFF